MEKLNPYGERIMVGGAEVGRNRSAGMSSVTGMSSMTGEMKGFLQVQTGVDKILEEATSENPQELDWAANFTICDFLNSGKLSGQDFTICDFLNSGKLSAQDLVEMIDDPHTIAGTRNKILQLIQAWEEHSEDLPYLPVLEETYKALKSRGIRFPGHGNGIPSPPLGIPVGYPSVTLDQEQTYQNVFVPQVSNLSQEQKQESFAVARNNILDTVLVQDEGKESNTPDDAAFQNADDSCFCVICRNTIQPKETAQIEGCGHNYCVSCILLWAYRVDHRWCPQCKHPFSSLYVYRASDGSMYDDMTEESIYRLFGAPWFVPPSKIRSGNRRWGIKNICSVLIISWFLVWYCILQKLLS